MLPRAIVSVLLFLVAACQTGPSTHRLPNVVLILGDDQAFGDFGFMGHPEIRTPCLDRLAAEGMTFPRGYVPSSLCRPSLATLISGLYPHQHGITGNDPPREVARSSLLGHLAAVDTLPRMLAARGYRSFQAGKWWEGNHRTGGFTAGMTHGDPERGGRHGDEGLRIGRQTMQPIADFLAACGDEPFFLWYAPMLPHQPHNPPERLLAHYRVPGRSLPVARYHAMCEWFDETCGQLLYLLDRRGLTENTLVLFVVDNGWIQRPNRGGYAPRSKRSPYEAGVRTPILARWPARIRPGVCDVPVSTVDIVPTVLAACGLDVPDRLPGRDLLAVADGAPPRPVFGEVFAHDIAYISDTAQSLLYRWVVDGRWKLIVAADPRTPAELYDVVTDPMEQRDLAADLPARVAALRGLLDGWWRGP